MLLPLLSADEVRVEIAETDTEIDLMGEGRVVCRERWLEARGRKLARRAKLVAQLAEMGEAE